MKSVGVMTVAMVSALAMILSGCGGDAEEASSAFLAPTNVTSNTTSNITTAAPENSAESTFYDGVVADNTTAAGMTANSSVTTAPEAASNATMSSAPGMANETNMTESDSGNSTGSQMPNSTASTNATANATVGNESSAPTTNSSA